MTDEPRYSEDEVALVLRRAAELSATTPRKDDGSTLAEIEQIADEAGIPRALVRRAAAEMVVPSPTSGASHRFLGGPAQLSVERVVDGEYPPEQFDRLVELLEAAAGPGGRISRIGGTLSYTIQRKDLVRLSATISVRDGRTKIRVSEDLSDYGGLVHIGSTVGLGWMGFVAGGVLAGPVGAIGIGLGLVGVLYGLGRRHFARRASDDHTALQQLADQLVRTIEERRLADTGANEPLPP